MNRMKRIKFIIPVLFSLLLITSCSDHEGTIYDQGDKQNALFLTNRYSFEVEQSEVTVKLYRGNTNNAADVSLTLDFFFTLFLLNKPINHEAAFQTRPLQPLRHFH